MAVGAITSRAAVACVADGAKPDWPVGTSNCDIAGLPDEIRQQVELSRCACSVVAGAASVFAIIGEPSWHSLCESLLARVQQLASAAAGAETIASSRIKPTNLYRMLTIELHSSYARATITTVTCVT